MISAAGFVDQHVFGGRMTGALSPEDRAIGFDFATIVNPAPVPLNEILLSAQGDSEDDELDNVFDEDYDAAVGDDLDEGQVTDADEDEEEE